MVQNYAHLPLLVEMRRSLVCRQPLEELHSGCSSAPVCSSATSYPGDLRLYATYASLSALWVFLIHICSIGHISVLVDRVSKDFKHAEQACQQVRLYLAGS